MYNAIKHQLNLQGLNEYSVDDLRKLTAHTLRKEKDNYMPFLLNPETDELMNDQEYEQYCIDVELNKKWGSDIELQIISKKLKVNINVYQADGPVIKFNSDKLIINNPLLISFHKHLYQLGSHYNSLVKLN